MSSGVYLRCNSCWCDLDGKSVVTACQHLFCLKCAQDIVESNSGCSICRAVISKSTVKLVASLQDAAAVKMLLCGHVPEVAFQSALASVEFFIAQQQMQAEQTEARLTNKVTKVQDACRKKLDQLHTSYKEAKRKAEEALSSKEQALQDTQDLQEKLTQRSMQARKLQEMFKKLQQQYEQEKSAWQQESRAAQQQIRALQQENQALRQNGGGFGGGRSISPLATGEMVTTVKRTTANFISTSPPNIGGFGKAMQQSLPPSSGRVQGITGGYRAQQGVGGSGAGGRILGGSMHANSPDAILPSSSQGLGRTGSDGSFERALGGGPRHSNGVMASGQNPHDPELRRILGMKPANGSGRDAAIENSLFSL